MAPTYPQAVTIEQLLTHTAGFDYDLDDVGTAPHEAPALPTLAASLTAHPPVRLLPPGRKYLNSNAAYDVLGAVVEGVAGQPFVDYAEAQIFRPLGMRRSSFRQPSPFAADVAPGYILDGGALRRAPPRVFPGAPSRALTSTALELLESPGFPLVGVAARGGRSPVPGRAMARELG